MLALNIIIIFNLLLVFAACAPNKSATNNGVNNLNSDKNCKGTEINRAWTDVQIQRTVEFNGDCTGSIPSCETEFVYDIKDMDLYSGYIYVYVKKAPTSLNNCRYFEQDGIYDCYLEFERHGTSLQAMYMNCGAETVLLTPSYGLE